MSGLDRETIDRWKSENKARARLEAAAPDLLNALKALHDAVEGAWPSLAKMGPMNKARAAIAKATGGDNE
jgi:hypothetical protein